MPDQPLPTEKGRHQMALLANGKVIVAGGILRNNLPTSSCEFYTSSTGWQPARSMKTPRYLYTLTPFDNNTKLLATGGMHVQNEKTAEIYDSATDTWTLIETNMSINRVYHSATLLGNGQILIVGGFDASLNVSSTTEIYIPSSNSFLNTNDMISSRQSATSTLLSDGSTVLVTGGVNDRRNITGTAELYVNGSWIRTTSNMNKFRAYHAAVLLNDGNVLIAGGGDFSASFAAAEIYNATTRTFTAVGSMKYPRMDFTLTLLPSGKVLATGGADLKTNTHPPVCELYDPVTRSWSDTHLLNDARASHQSVLLNDSVLTVGGRNVAVGCIGSSEKYYF
jgi:N-acetylneuraminic acid mutarotase